MDGVDDRGDLVVIATEVLDDQRGIVVADELRRERRHCVSQQRRLVAAHEVCGRLVRHIDSASSTAAIVSQTRRVPLTSWARMILHPRATPSAVAASV